MAVSLAPNDIGPFYVGLDADNPLLSKLIVAAELTAADEAARIEAELSGIDVQRSAKVGRAARVSKRLALEAATGVGADEAAGPGEERRLRRNRCRLINRRDRAEIGRQGGVRRQKGKRPDSGQR